ncbi:hypothetical protein [Gemmobacter serpentinus]|uniref:hypothetical protein n=1 Tax=Gemmobacter serpentinus TaxID=2652247 RepID=UPI00124F2107|nr:hypothetical protein [Gemmobacter serpentinus]
MATHDELMETRKLLTERLAIETHRLSGAYQDERLGKIANVLAGIKAIDLVIENELEPPESDGPIGFFIG